MTTTTNTFVNFSQVLSELKLNPTRTGDCQLCGSVHPFHEMHQICTHVFKRRCASCFALYGSSAVKGKFREQQMELSA